jgi:hypothetical protein
MSDWQDLTQFMYGDVRFDKGFWYSHPLWEINGLTEEQLYWMPSSDSLCILWQVGHIAHRERTHIGRFLQGLKGEIIPPQYEVFGPEWCSAEEIQDSIDAPNGDLQGVYEWVRDVRAESNAYIATLADEDWHLVPPMSEFDMSVAKWLLITTAHTALHIGRIQLLRALVEGKRERAC